MRLLVKLFQLLGYLARFLPISYMTILVHPTNQIVLQYLHHFVFHIKIPIKVGALLFT